MRVHVTESLQQLNGEAALGFAIKWTIKNIFPKATSQRNHKVIIVVSAGESSEIQLSVTFFFFPIAIFPGYLFLFWFCIFF